MFVVLLRGVQPDRAAGAFEEGHQGVEVFQLDVPQVLAGPQRRLRAADGPGARGRGRDGPLGRAGNRGISWRLLGVRYGPGDAVIVPTAGGRPPAA